MTNDPQTFRFYFPNNPHTPPIFLELAFETENFATSPQNFSIRAPRVQQKTSSPGPWCSTGVVVDIRHLQDRSVQTAHVVC
jgi:hypothetical protein